MTCPEPTARTITPRFCFDEPVKLIEFGPLTDERRAEVEGDEADPFDAARVPPMQWRAKQRHVGLTDEGGRLVASAGLLVTEVEAGGEPFPVVGLGGVLVNQAHRGRGLSLRVVQAALDKAATLGPNFVVLFCHEDRMGLYRRFGFAEVRSEVLVEGESGQLVMAMRTMWLALRPGASWPDGPLVLQGRPF
jgi:predicted N-acetyltransferase YhbS